MDELEHFKKKYRAHIQPSTRRYAVPKRISMDPLSPSYEPFDLAFEYDPGVQIDMSKRDFEQLIGMEKYWEEQLNWTDTQHYAGYAKSIVDRHEKEMRVRNSNPAAAKAYEKYRLILGMADSYYD